MKVTNISPKIVGIGSLTLLPGATDELPQGYEKNPIVLNYFDNGVLSKSGLVLTPAQLATQKAAEEEAAKAAEELKAKEAEEAAKAAEELKKAQLASLKTITSEDLLKLADSLGIKNSDCKDEADMKAKVKAALEA